MENRLHTECTTELGYFIPYSLWENACRLLGFQIQEKRNGKHYYKTLSMNFYNNVWDLLTEVYSHNYFENRVKNNFFYGLEKDFYFIDYATPKPKFGIRNYKYFSLLTRLVYYALALYLVQITQEFVDNFIKSKKRISAYYGGNLFFEKGSSLKLSSSLLWYYSPYLKYRKELKREAAHNRSNKAVIRFDVQNYFDSIDPEVLCKNLEQYLKPSIKKKYNFDLCSIEQIIFFLKYLSGNKTGVPQLDNDVCSNFLGYIYLCFADLLIEDELKKESLHLSEYKLIRYVDDHFIFINFSPTLSRQDQEKYVQGLMSKISDMLYFDFGLKLNHKTSIYWISEDDELRKFLEGIKRISQRYELPPDSESKSVEDAAQKIISTLYRVNQLPLDEQFCYELKDDEEESLRTIYEEPVSNYLSSNIGSQRLIDLFKDFKFDLVKVFPKAITVLISLNPVIRDNYRDFLCNKEYLSTSDCDLIIQYLCQVDFKDEILIEKLKSSSLFNKIFSVNNSYSVSCETVLYLDISIENIAPLLNSNFIEQVKLRKFNENLRHYSLALSHLCNELCAIISYFSNKNIYKSNDIQQYLEAEKIENHLRIKVQNLFDRRNKNKISHAGYSTNIAWGVSKEEYEEYKEAVKCTLEYLFKKNTLGQMPVAQSFTERTVETSA